MIILKWLGEKLAIVGGVLATVAGLFFYAKRQGKKEEQSAETAKALEQAKEASDVDARVRSMSDKKLDEELKKNLRS